MPEDAIDPVYAQLASGALERGMPTAGKSQGINPQLAAMLPSAKDTQELQKLGEPIREAITNAALDQVLAPAVATPQEIKTVVEGVALMIAAEDAGKSKPPGKIDYSDPQMVKKFIDKTFELADVLWPRLRLFRVREYLKEDRKNPDFPLELRAAIEWVFSDAAMDAAEGLTDDLDAIFKDKDINVPVDYIRLKKLEAAGELGTAHHQLLHQACALLKEAQEDASRPGRAHSDLWGRVAAFVNTHGEGG